MVHNLNYLIAIPAFNEEETLEKLYSGVVKFNLPLSIFNDGSIDNTDLTIKTLERFYSSRLPINNFVNKTNQGYGANFKLILDYARSNRIRYLIILDGDLQHDPKYVEFFLHKLKKYPVVHGNRWGITSEALSETPNISIFGREVTKEIISLWGIKASDPLCGFWGFDLNKLPSLDLSAAGYSLPIEFWYKLNSYNIIPHETPISSIYFDKDFLKRDNVSLVKDFASTTLKIISNYPSEEEKRLKEEFCEKMLRLPQTGKLKLHSDQYQLIESTFKKIIGK
jgi:dolichol-phosphate mannosyltransferase